MAGLLSPFLMGPAQSLGPMAGLAPQASMSAAPVAAPAPSGMSGIGSRLRGMLAPEVALPAAQALMTGRTFGEGLGNAFGAAGQGMQAQQQKNTTRTWLQSMGLKPPEVEAAMSNPAILTYYLKQAAGNEGPASVQEWQHFNNLSQEDQARYLRMKRANPYLDIGTGFVQPDPVNPGGISGGPIVKENYQKKFDEGRGLAEGKAAGEAGASYQSMLSKMPGLEQVVAKLDELSEKATYTLGGQVLDSARRQLGEEPREAAVARAEYVAMIDNQILPLLRDTFGAQFTEREGAALRATLGDPDKSPKEKQAILKAFIEQKRRDIEALAQQSGQQAPAAAPQRLRFNPVTGELE